MFAANVDSSVVDSSVSVSGPLAGMFGNPTIEPLIDSQVDATASAAPVPESPVAVTSDASVCHATNAPLAMKGSHPATQQCHWLGRKQATGLHSWRAGGGVEADSSKSAVAA